MTRHNCFEMTGLNIDALELIANTPSHLVYTKIPGVICFGGNTIVIDKALRNDVFPITDAPIMEKRPSLRQKVLRMLKK
ncbi:MAG: hypothetical protein IJN90_04090 [Bacilli bacterium]|nr:hypothetical protein [Bacilli bacterium]